MPGDDSLDILLSSDLVWRTDDGSGYVVTDRIEESIQRYVTELDELHESDIRAKLSDRLDTEATADRVLQLTADDDLLLARYLALSEHLERAELETTLRLLVVLNRLLDAPLPTEGVPDNAVPVRGEHLRFYLEIYDEAVVYVWRHDCEPCDGVRETLDDILSDEPSDVTLLAVYGPDSAQYLQQEFDIVGGPTTLFVNAGDVDARVQGVRSRQVFETEFDRTRGKAGSTER